MKTMLVTGAGGFIGRAVVRQALSAGWSVRAIVRRDTPVSDQTNSCEYRVADLRIDNLAPLLDDVDVVLHLAAAKSGDFHTQYASTVRGTERLLNAVVVRGVPRLVLCSSIAVYDYDYLKPGAIVDESTRLDLQNDKRDAYAQTKILQEQLSRHVCGEARVELVVLRPGVVFGPDLSWTYRVGERFGRLWVGLGNRSRVPLVSVDDCARAFILAAASPSMAGETYNVVADQPPTQAEYRRALARTAPQRPVRVTLPWSLALATAKLSACYTSHSSLPWRMPDFLVPASLAVQAKPLLFSNEHLRAAGWNAHVDWKNLQATC